MRMNGPRPCDGCAEGGRSARPRPSIRAVFLRWSPPMPRIVLSSLITLAALSAVEAEVLDTFDEMTLKAGNDKVRVEPAVGRSGKAVQVAFAAECASSFAMGRVRGRPEWDQAAGISFWVKGDGSTTMGALQFVWNDDYAVRYDAAFPIRSTEWTRVVIPWRDLIPV